MTRPEIPEPLRRTIASDLRPVRPLPPLWKRAMAVAVTVVAVAVAVLITHALRPDLVTLSPWVGWGAALFEGLIGLLIMALALRESVPGRALSGGVLGIVIGLAIVSNLIVVIATRLDVAGSAGMWGPLTRGMMCSRNELMFALPALLVTIYLVIRAFPLRPQIVGMLAGLGAGLTADGINHLLCPVSSLMHVLVWHTGAMLGLMIFGWCFGQVWTIVQIRRIDHSGP